MFYNSVAIYPLPLKSLFVTKDCLSLEIDHPISFYVFTCLWKDDLSCQTTGHSASLDIREGPGYKVEKLRQAQSALWAIFRLSRHAILSYVRSSPRGRWTTCLLQNVVETCSWRKTLQNMKNESVKGFIDYRSCKFEWGNENDSEDYPNEYFYI